MFSLDRKRISESSAIYDVTINVVKTTRVNEIFDLPPSFQKFIRYAKERILKFRGADKQYLQLYLKEIEFRYNNWRVNVFNRLGIVISKNFQVWLDMTCV